VIVGSVRTAATVLFPGRLTTSDEAMIIRSTISGCCATLATSRRPSAKPRTPGEAAADERSIDTGRVG